MNVCTKNYIEDHGKAPKGKARWAFTINRGGAWTEFVVPVEMTLAEAKKQAIREARSLGADFVQVAV